MPALFFIHVKSNFPHSHIFRIVIFSCGNSSLFLLNKEMSLFMFNFACVLKSMPDISRGSLDSLVFPCYIFLNLFTFTFSLSIFISFQLLLLLSLLFFKSRLMIFVFTGEYTKYFIWWLLMNFILQSTNLMFVSYSIVPLSLYVSLVCLHLFLSSITLLLHFLLSIYQNIHIYYFFTY